jgi:NADPH:quinone reductase-like Zn-dependent oxidoreductase
VTRQAIYRRFGRPHQVLEFIDDDAGPTGPDDVVIAVEAVCLHIADVLRITGQRPYASDTFPASPGSECVGRVIEIGVNARGFKLGDRAIPPLGTRSCRERIRLPARDFIRVPQGGDLLQLAMATVNPVTSWLLVNAYEPLKPGDWILQNGGNSACGRYVIQLARRQGYRTVSAVRRREVIPELEALGADAVVLDDPSLPDEVRRATGGAEIRLALDVAGGANTGWLAHCLADSGIIVNYGNMSGADAVLPKELIIGRGLRFQGFLMSRTFRRHYTPALERAVRTEIAQLVGSGALSARVATTYPFERLADALEHADRRGAERHGKILVKMPAFA